MTNLEKTANKIILSPYTRSKYLCFMSIKYKGICKKSVMKRWAKIFQNGAEYRYGSRKDHRIIQQLDFSY